MTIPPLGPVSSRVACVVVAVLIVGCAKPAADQPDSSKAGGPATTASIVGPPRVVFDPSKPFATLEFRAGGNTSTSYQLHDGVLETKSVGGFGPQQGQVLGEGRGTPSAEAWVRFHDTLTALRVWSWPETFRSEASNQMDGVGWSFVVTQGEKRFETRGYNAAPRELSALAKALSELTRPPAAAP